MRVLYLTINPNTWGTTRILCNWMDLGKAVDIQGHLVTLADTSLVKWASEHQIPSHVNPLQSPTWSTLIQTHYHAMQVARFARRHRIQIIHCNEHNVYGFLRVLHRYLPLPIVCHTRYILEKRFADWAFRPPFKPAALLWTSHQQMQDSHNAVKDIIPADKQHIMSLGLDMDHFGKRVNEREGVRAKWGYKPDDVVFGMWCALQPRKRPYDYINAAAKLIRENPNVKAVLAAQVYPEHQAYCDEMLQYIASLNLGNSLQWLGHVDPVETLIHGIDIAISTSEYDTFGMSVCEAMACHKPVIAYRGGSVYEVMGDTGVVLENGDEEGLYQQMARLAGDAVERKRLGDMGYERVMTEYNPHVHVQRLAEIYRNILNEASPS